MAEAQRPIRSALDLPADGMSDFEKKLIANVRRYGFQTNYVFSEDEDAPSPSFCYSIGFWRTIGFPEVIVFGLPSESAESLLQHIHKIVSDGKTLPIQEPFSDLANFDLMLMPVGQQANEDYLRSATWFYDTENFPSLQLVWPDPKGLFPWLPGFAERFKGNQPDLSIDGWPSKLM